MHYMYAIVDYIVLMIVPSLLRPLMITVLLSRQTPTLALCLHLEGRGDRPLFCSDEVLNATRICN